jgi:hypothetical protein
MVMLVRVGPSQLDLIWLSEDEEQKPSASGERPNTLLVSVVPRDTARVLDPERLARAVRARVEREYARQGISPVEYDLQLL